MPGPIPPISGAALPVRHPPGGRSARRSARSRTCSPNAIQQCGDLRPERLGSGGALPFRGGRELHTTILAAQRAELSFDLFLQARNKVVSAYQEIMRMQM